jgi:glyoxylate/hydroxypyruvate reductase A
MSVLYISDPVRGQAWSRLFKQQAPELEFHVWPETGDLNAVDTLVAWAPKPKLLQQLPNLKILYSVGAGIDHVDMSALSPAVLLVRMIEPGITEGVVEYVLMAVLAAHRQLLDYREQQARKLWQMLELVAAGKRSVGVMGLGVLGQATLAALRPFGFACSGWSRSRKQLAGVRCYAGPQELDAFLAGCDILICLLPLTYDTRGILNERTLSALPRGAALINAGRGAHVDEAALLRALDSGQLSRAFIDVFESEPLPAAHPFWTHPRLVLTPHVAGVTNPATAVPVVIENLRRYRRGEALHGLIDRTIGY